VQNETRKVMDGSGRGLICGATVTSVMKKNTHSPASYSKQEPSD
jgi:hypothetical protein